MTKYTKRFIIVVTKDKQTASNLQAKKVDKNQKLQDRTWGVGLSPTGKGNPTHYWCNWQMIPEESNELKILLKEIPGDTEQIFELNHWDPHEARPTPDEILKMTTPKLKRIESELSSIEPRPKNP